MTIAEAIEKVVKFDGDVGYLISHSKYSFEPAVPPVTVSMTDCERVASELRDTKVREDLAIDWARFLLGRRDVIFERGAEDVILDFLEDLSFSKVQFELDTAYFSSMLARMTSKRPS